MANTFLPLQLVAEATGGNFKIGALAAGANEALIDTLANQYDNMSQDQRSGLLTMNSQVLGVLVASMAGGDEKDIQTGAWVAGNATSYNHDLHRENAESFAQAVLDACATQPQRCAVDPDSVTYDDLMQTLEVMAAHGEGFNDLNPHAVALVNQYYNNDLYRDRLEADLFQLTESEQSRLQTEQVAELVMAGAGLGAAAVKGGPGIVSWVKGLFGTKSSTGAENAINGVKLNSKLLAEEVASGHAFKKHVVERQEFADLGIRTNNQFQNFIEKIVSNPSVERRYAVDGTIYYLDSSTKTIVIRGQRGEATAFRPDKGGVGWENYIKSQVPKK